MISSLKDRKQQSLGRSNSNRSSSKSTVKTTRSGSRRRSGNFRANSVNSEVTESSSESSKLCNSTSKAYLDLQSKCQILEKHNKSLLKTTENQEFKIMELEGDKEEVEVELTETKSRLSEKGSIYDEKSVFGEKSVVDESESNHFAPSIVTLPLSESDENDAEALFQRLKAADELKKRCTEQDSVILVLKKRIEDIEYDRIEKMIDLETRDEELLEKNSEISELKSQKGSVYEPSNQSVASRSILSKKIHRTSSTKKSAKRMSSSNRWEKMSQISLPESQLSNNTSVSSLAFLELQKEKESLAFQNKKLKKSLEDKEFELFVAEGEIEDAGVELKKTLSVLQETESKLSVTSGSTAGGSVVGGLIVGGSIIGGSCVSDYDFPPSIVTLPKSECDDQSEYGERKNNNNNIIAEKLILKTRCTEQAEKIKILESRNVNLDFEREELKTEIDEQKCEIEKRAQEILRLQSLNKKFNFQIDMLKGELEDNNFEISEKNVEIERKNTENNKLNSKLDQKNAEIKAIETEMRYKHEKTSEKHVSEINTLKKRLETETDNINRLQKQNNEIKTKLETKKSEMKKLHTQVTLANKTVACQEKIAKKNQPRVSIRDDVSECGSNKSGSVKSGSVKSGSDKSGSFKSGSIESGSDKSGTSRKFDFTGSKVSSKTPTTPTSDNFSDIYDFGKFAAQISSLQNSKEMYKMASIELQGEIDDLKIELKSVSEKQEQNLVKKVPQQVVITGILDASEIFIEPAKSEEMDSEIPTDTDQQVVKLLKRKLKASEKCKKTELKKSIELKKINDNLTLELEASDNFKQEVEFLKTEVSKISDEHSMELAEITAKNLLMTEKIDDFSNENDELSKRNRNLEQQVYTEKKQNKKMASLLEIQSSTKFPDSEIKPENSDSVKLLKQENFNKFLLAKIEQKQQEISLYKEMDKGHKSDLKRTLSAASNKSADVGLQIELQKVVRKFICEKINEKKVTYST